MDFNNKNYQLRDLNEEELSVYNASIGMFQSLGEQLEFINSLITENEDEENEKAEFMLKISTTSANLARSIIHRFYNVTDNK